jgi:hypothetical protein
MAKVTLDGRRVTFKAVNVFAVVPYAGTGLDNQFTWFADATNIRNFARHLQQHGFNAIRLPVTNDATNSYLDTVKAVGDALWESGIATLVCPFDGGTFLPTGPGGFDTVGAMSCGYWLSYAWDYMGQPAWFLMDSYNEPESTTGAGDGSLTDAEWKSGMTTLLAEARMTGYDGPIFVEAPGWSWHWPTTSGQKYSDLAGTDPKIVAQVHRYVTQDLGSGPVAVDGADSRTWRAEWPDNAAADAIAMVVGEFGPCLPGSGDYGSGSSFEPNVLNWCRSMAAEIELAVRQGKCSGSFAWTWVWLDFTTDPGNSMVTYTDTDWNNFTAGNNIPARNLWGNLVYRMFDDAAEDPYRGFFTVGGTTFTQTLSGSITPAGALVKQTAKRVTGTITPAGALVKAVSKPLAGSITPAGAITNLRLKLLALSGSITPAGALVKAVTKPLAGSITPAGALRKAVSKNLAGSITPSGTIANVRAKLLALSGSIAPAGALRLQTAKALSGALSPSGALSKATSKRVTGTITPAGAVAKSTAKALAGAITPAGGLRKAITKLLGGLITPSGTLSSPSFPAVSQGDWDFEVVGWRWTAQVDELRWSTAEGVRMRTEWHLTVETPRWSFGPITKD